MSGLESRLADIFRAEDVEGLIALGAPADEYDTEARDIGGAVSELSGDQRTAENIVAIMARVWAKSFDRDEREIQLRLPAFRRVAERFLT